MNALTPPRHTYVDRAMRLAKAWCRDHQIDGAPALRHAALVARTLGDYVPDAAPELFAAALLHDAELFAPKGIHLDFVLNNGVAPGVARIVRAIGAEHAAMDHGEMPYLNDRDVILVSAADKIVAFQSLRRRAARSGDGRDFWCQRPVLLGLMPYFRQWITYASPSIPCVMQTALTGEFEQLSCAIYADASSRSVSCWALRWAKSE